MPTISRSDLERLDGPAKITDVKHLSSYSWLEASEPTIIVPGLPPLWSPLTGSQKLRQDSGLVYIAQNAARYPEFPVEPLFRSLLLMNPKFDLGTLNLITDRNNLRKLLQFVQPGRSKYALEAFTIKAENKKGTTVLARTEAVTSEVIGPGDFRGFGRQFERTYTTPEINGCTGHHRVLSFRFCGMEMMVRHETDGYVKNTATGPANMKSDELSDLLGGLSLRTGEGKNRYTTVGGTRLRIQEMGNAIPDDSIMEIKTRTAKKPISIDEVAPQLWVSQTPKLVRAYHYGGTFTQPSVEDVTTNLQAWEANNQPDLTTFGWLLKKIISVTKDLDGKALIQYNPVRDELSITPDPNAADILPEDLYARWSSTKASEGEIRSAVTSEVKGSQHKQSIPGNLPFAPVIRAALDKGLRQVFRDMPLDLNEYHVLCQSLETARVDVLQGRQMRELVISLRKGKEEWNDEGDRKVAESKADARDSAFRLIFFLLQGHVTDGNSAYNATVFVVSHYRIFGYRIRKMVRIAYESKFVPTSKQRQELDKWKLDGASDEDDATTEEDDIYCDDYDSDWS